MIIDKLNERLLKKLQKDNRDSTDVFRCSSAGSCTRQLAYKRLGYEGEPLSARALKVFRMGDLVEFDMICALGIKDLKQEHIISLLESVGIELGDLTEVEKKKMLKSLYKKLEGGLIEEPQLKLDADLGGLVLSGHIDGLYYCPELKEKFVIDFKSINTRGFARANKGEVDTKYKIQMCLYMHALGLKRAILLYYNKDTSAMCEAVVEYDPKIIEEVKQKFIKVAKATKDNLPDRDFDIEDKATGWICNYCPYTILCHPDRELTIEKGKPKYIKKEEGNGKEGS